MRMKKEVQKKLNANIQNNKLVDLKNYCRYVSCNCINKCQNR